MRGGGCCAAAASPSPVITWPIRLTTDVLYLKELRSPLTACDRWEVLNDFFFSSVYFFLLFICTRHGHIFFLYNCFIIAIASSTDLFSSYCPSFFPFFILLFFFLLVFHVLGLVFFFFLFLRRFLFLPFFFQFFFFISFFQ